jgi:hypothetical protein
MFILGPRLSAHMDPKSFPVETVSLDGGKDMKLFALTIAVTKYKHAPAMTPAIGRHGSIPKVAYQRAKRPTDEPDRAAIEEVLTIEPPFGCLLALGADDIDGGSGTENSSDANHLQLTTGARANVCNGWKADIGFQLTSAGTAIADFIARRELLRRPALATGRSPVKD